MGLLDWLFGPNFKKLKENADIHGLSALLEHKDPRCRERAIWALESLGAHCPAEPLVSALRDQSPHVRLSAALALLSVDPANGKKRLEGFIQGTQELTAVKVAAAIALDYAHEDTYTSRDCLAMARATPQQALVEEGMGRLRWAGHLAGYSKFLEALEGGAKPELRRAASGVLRGALSADCVRDAHVDRLRRALVAREGRGT